MPKFFEGLAVFTEFLEKQAALQEAALHEGAKAASVVVQKRVQAVFGDTSKLLSLADATQADRVAHGYTPNDPLVRTGTLRDSIERESVGPVAVVGSKDPIMGYQEFGTSKIPPRPVFEIGLTESQDEVGEIAGAVAAIALGMPGHAAILANASEEP